LPPRHVSDEQSGGLLEDRDNDASLDQGAQAEHLAQVVFQVLGPGTGDRRRAGSVADQVVIRPEQCPADHRCRFSIASPDDGRAGRRPLLLGQNVDGGFGGVDKEVPEGGHVRVCEPCQPPGKPVWAVQAQAVQRCEPVLPELCETRRGVRGRRSHPGDDLGHDHGSGR
jgi:hypothetical protein